MSVPAKIPEPVQAPAVADTRSPEIDGGLVVRVDPKNLILAITLLLGGAVGGAGTSLVGEAKPAPAVTEALSELRDDMRALSAAIADMKLQLERTSTSSGDMRQRIEDHERRLRELEARPRR